MNMLTTHYQSMTAMNSDYYITGKLYPKLDAYLYVREGDDMRTLYIGSSCQFRTQRRYKQWLLERHTFVNDSVIKIVKAEK